MNAQTQNMESMTMVLKSIKDGLIVTDKRARITFINPAAEKMAGVTRKMAYDQPVNDVITLLAPETRKPMRIPTPRVFLKEGKPREFRNVIVSNGDDQEITVNATLTPLKEDRGRITGSVLILCDTTDLLREERQALEDQTLDTLGKMAGNIALDFSNWLSVISGHASSIAESILSGTRAHEDALKIIDATERAGELTRRLSSIATVGTEQDTDTIEHVRLLEVVPRAVDLVAGATEERGIEFKIKDLDHTPDVLSNDRQLLDCLVNLFLNSFDALPQGGTITLDASETSIKGTKYVVLRVRDNGIGIPRDLADRIFDPFFTTKPAGTAIGLGLTAVNTSVKNWGGFLKVRSREGQGTSIRLFIPRAPTQTTEKRVVESGGETILLADDKEDVLAEAKDILESAGYRVFTATDGHECVHLYKQHAEDIHLTIVDVIMPGKDGKRVLEDILDVNPMAQIVMVSGFSRDYVRGYMKKGAWGFAQKPFDDQQLLGTVRRILDQKK